MADQGINVNVVNTVIEAVVKDVTNLTNMDVSVTTTHIDAVIKNGAQGRSAYEIWIGQGHTGSEQDFLNWLKSDSYVHTQVAANISWTIIHNLGKWPSVTIVDDGNNLVYGDVQYISNNELKVSFTGAFSGKAYLN